MEETTTTLIAHKIPACNFGELDEKLTKMARKAKKLGSTPITWNVASEYTEVVEELNTYTGEKVEKHIVYYNVEVSGERPQFKGPQFDCLFIGLIEHVLIENKYFNVLRMVPGTDLPEETLKQWRHVAPHCEHCKLPRNRKDTILIQNKATGVIMQLGKQCIKDFLGHKDPHVIASMLTWLDDIDHTMKAYEEEREGRGERVWAQEEYLTWVAATIRLCGWISGTRAREEGGPSTASLAVMSMDDFKAGKNAKNKVHHTEKIDHEVACKALAWIRSLDFDTLKDSYMRDLWIVCKHEGATHRQLGLVASLLISYSKHVENIILKEKRAKESGASKHVHTVGERVKGMRLTVTFRTECETMYGVSTLYKFLDEQKNVLVWFSSSNHSLEQNDVVTLDATIKRHSVYTDRKTKEEYNQTELTRATVKSVAKVASVTK